ncbi:xylulokinase [Cohnella zeiphila]|uniref:Xylulokinase n=1 Tax=Cohnella zeiphila TaxID=2761120 RepID=A0A7X0SGM1_9BACL|nr:FGGY family carbohydrate kinase [Cohnella zeiphila]MBB6729604.1 hypothetical protein [Cohnella zeiphila]
MDIQPLLLGVDIGSTSVKCVAVEPDGTVAAAATGTYPIASPRPGWVEQRPEHWWRAAARAIRECVAGTDASRIAAVSFSGNMSAMVLADRRGRPVRPSMLVADTRAARQAEWLKERYGEEIAAMTGNEPLAAFVAPRLLWLRENDPGALTESSRFAFPKDYIRFRLTGEWATEPTDAGNTLLFDPAKGDWAWKLIRELGIDPALFPPLCSSAEKIGRVTKEAAVRTGLPEGTPVVAGGADMACSQLGTGILAAGETAVTLSTSIQVVTPLREPIRNLAGFTFHPSAVKGTFYAMGSVFTGGLGVDWGLRMLTGDSVSAAPDRNKLERWTEAMKDIPPGSRGLLFLPFLVGSGSPSFDERDRASWLGLTLGQDKPLLLHSVLEGISYNIRDNLELLERAGIPVRELRIGGGGSRNPVWCRMVGNVAGKPASLIGNRDASALGAAMLAGIGTGCYASAEDAVAQAVRLTQRLEPEPDAAGRYDEMYPDYQEVCRSLNRYYVGRKRDR